VKPATITVPTRARLVSEADVRKLHERLEWARRTFRPEEGFLTDAPQPKLPARRASRV
jgi:hypothetical protein